jgi:GAF domain-containing protein
MVADDKAARYESSLEQISGLLEGLQDPITTMASVAAVLHGNLSWASWVGFYRVVAEGLLRVGPYQGPVGCLEIPFDRGVCGAAARQRRTQVVADVHSFPGHIACDARARSEIVVPVFDSRERLVAVLDLDSHQPSAFDDMDRHYLERLAAMLAPPLSAPAEA